MVKNKNKEKSYYQLERIVKGFANHRRIEILELLKREPELSVIDVHKKIRDKFQDRVRAHQTAGYCRSGDKTVRRISRSAQGYRPRSKYSQILENIGIDKLKLWKIF